MKNVKGLMLSLPDFWAIGVLAPALTLNVPEAWLRLRVVRMVTPLVPRHGGT